MDRLIVQHKLMSKQAETALTSKRDEQIKAKDTNELKISLNFWSKRIKKQIGERFRLIYV